MGCSRCRGICLMTRPEGPCHIFLTYYSHAPQICISFRPCHITAEPEGEENLKDGDWGMWTDGIVVSVDGVVMDGVAEDNASRGDWSESGHGLLGPWQCSIFSLNWSCLTPCLVCWHPVQQVNDETWLKHQFELLHTTIGQEWCNKRLTNFIFVNPYIKP